MNENEKQTENNSNKNKIDKSDNKNNAKSKNADERKANRKDFNKKSYYNNKNKKIEKKVKKDRNSKKRNKEKTQKEETHLKNINQNKISKISEEQLGRIKDELKESKIQNSKNIIKFTKNRNKIILTNLVIAILFECFVRILYLGLFNIATVEYIEDLRNFIILLLGIGIFVIELGYKKESTKIFLNGIETLVMSGTILMLYSFCTRDVLNSQIAFRLIYIMIIYYYLIKCAIFSYTVKN